MRAFYQVFPKNFFTLTLQCLIFVQVPYFISYLLFWVVKFSFLGLGWILYFLLDGLRCWQDILWYFILYLQFNGFNFELFIVLNYEWKLKFYTRDRNIKPKLYTHECRGTFLWLKRSNFIKHIKLLASLYCENRYGIIIDMIVLMTKVGITYIKKLYHYLVKERKLLTRLFH